MIELNNNLTKIIPIYEELKMEFLFNSIIEGFTPGKVFVNQIENPTIAIVFEGSAMYFGGKSENPNDYIEAIEFVKNRLDKHEKIYYLKLIYTSDVWKKHLDNILNNYEMTVYNRILYKHSLDKIPNSQMNHDIKYYSIDYSFLNYPYKNKEMVIDEILGCWGTLEKFYQNGFGSCAVKDDEIIGWCTSEYMSKTQCGLGIETLEDHQKQGVAFNTATYVLNECKKRGITPHWDSWSWNIPSVKVAEKCLFNKINEYQTILLKSKNI